MISNKEMNEVKVVLQAQKNLVNGLEDSIGKIEESFSDIDSQSIAIQKLQKQMKEIELDSNLLTSSDIEGFDPTQIESIYSKNRENFQNELQSLNYQDWKQFVGDCRQYCQKNNLEATIPWEAMLSEQDIELLKKDSYDNKFRWDKWDYIFVGAAGVIAFLTDIFLVRIPKESAITESLKEIKFPPEIQKWLESVSKVPYDNTGGGNHRIDTFGHDPVIGWIIGVIDIMRGGATSIKQGGIVIESGKMQSIGIIEALLKQFLHIASDAFTSKGLPVPFATIFRALSIGSFKGPNGKSHTISEMAMWMYHHGYDLRHFITMGITPASIEIFLRAYLMIRHYSEFGETKFLLANNPKYRSMFLVAHAIACAGNVGKVTLMQGNPLAINYTEWLALTRYLVPSVKYWLFDKSQLKWEYIEKINQEGWDELLTAGDSLLKRSYEESLPLICLGEC